jgi:hypothetical protein
MVSSILGHSAAILAEGAHEGTGRRGRAAGSVPPALPRPAARDADQSALPRAITDLAEQEGLTDAYVCRLVPLTCLAPNIVEAILDGRQPKGLRLAEILGNAQLDWNEQRMSWGL